MRLLRGNVPLVLDEYDYKFELGKAKLLRDGDDVLIISTGFMTMRALEAAKALRGRPRRRRRCCTCRRSSRWTRRRSCARPRRNGRLVVVAENHTVIGGLGEAVARTLLRSGVTPTFRQIALPDEFLDAGALPTLHDRYGISTEAMATQHQGLAGAVAGQSAVGRIRRACSASSRHAPTAGAGHGGPHCNAGRGRTLWQMGGQLPANQLQGDQLRRSSADVGFWRGPRRCPCAASSPTAPAGPSSSTSWPRARTRPIRSTSARRRR